MAHRRDDNAWRRAADRVGLVLIAVVVASGVLLGRGGLAQLYAEGSAGLLSPMGTDSGTPSPVVDAEDSPDASAQTGPGLLGEPPAPRLVYPHIMASSSGSLMEARHRFAFEGQEYEVSGRLDSALYESAKKAKRRISEVPGESVSDRDAAAYRYMVQDPRQAPVISDVAMQLRGIAARRDMGPSRYAELIAKYVQSMPYDFSKLNAGELQTEFPIVTLVDGTGVCGDKSLLLAALLAHEGYDTALLLFRAENHMAVGIKGPGAQYRDSGYLFVETTSPTYVSDIPSTFISGVDLKSDPVVIPIGLGKQQYAKALDVARIIRIREAAQEASDALYRRSSSTPMTAEDADDVNRRLKLAYDSQFKLNVIEGHESEYLDRASALRWISQNCWWD